MAIGYGIIILYAIVALKGSQVKFVLREYGIMSMTINIFVNDIKNVSKADCEKFMQRFDIIAQIHPESDLKSDTGFLPFRVEFPSHEFLKGKSFLSGFEIGTDAYDYEQVMQTIGEALSKKSGCFFGLFKKKTSENTVSEKYSLIPVNTGAEAINDLLKKCSHVVALDISTNDSFEPILAPAFASYLVESCDGVICYPHSDEYFYESNKQEIFDQINDFLDELRPENLVSHPFEKWL